LLRISKQRLREAKLQATDYAILLIAGACVGTITKIGDSDFGAFGYSYTIIAICKSTAKCWRDSNSVFYSSILGRIRGESKVL